MARAACRACSRPANARAACTAPDRIGGLASANALVFGRRAGVAAAKFARGLVGECAGGGANARSETSGFASVDTPASGCGLDVGSCRDPMRKESRPKAIPATARCAGGSRFRSRCGSVSFEVEERAYPASGAALRELRETMSTHCMISRDADGLKAAANAISALQERVGEAAYAPVASFGSESEPASELMSASGLAPSSSPCSDAASIAVTMRIRLQLETASATIAAMLARKESCGSHYRQRRRSIADNAIHWPTVPLSDEGLLPGTVTPLSGARR